jgi:serine/threonine protein kinase
MRSAKLTRSAQIVMEHMEGGTLTEATKGHNFTEMQIAFVARELLSALVPQLFLHCTQCFPPLVLAYSHVGALR